MNSLKHLGLPVMAAGHTHGEELRWRQNGTLRKIFVEDGRIVGFRLTGDVSAAGIYRSLMNRREDISAYKDRLLQPGFGMGHIENLASSPIYRA
jgi:NAD(P)H-nitrite reductase large subunit